MGTKVEMYCDGCGDSIGDGTLYDAIQVTAMGSSGLPVVIQLCIKPEFPQPLPPYEPGPDEPVEPGVVIEPYTPTVPKIKGCARKVLTKAVLGTLYSEVAEYTGDENSKPFVL